MDTIQILLAIVLVLTTLFLSVIGFQLFFTLMEIKKTLKNINKVIDGIESAGLTFKDGFSEVSSFIHGFKTILRLIEVMPRSNDEKK